MSEENIELKRYLIEKHTKAGKFLSYEHINAKSKSDLRNKIEHFNKTNKNDEFLAYVTAKRFSPSDYKLNKNR